MAGSRSRSRPGRRTCPCVRLSRCPRFPSIRSLRAASDSSAIGNGSPGWTLAIGKRERSSTRSGWGPLEISAVEEARFVARLAQQKLDASIRSQSIARDIIRLESRDGKILYGKTGWRFSSAPNLGWWTGWVEQNGKISAFSLNIDMPAATDAPQRVAIGKTMLSKLGVL